LGVEHQAADPPAAPGAPGRGGRRASLLSLALFDVGGPLVVYYGSRAAGISTVVALVVSGLPPALGIALGVRRRRQIDTVGVVVLAGILVGAVVGLASGSARLVLLDGTVPTGVLGAACLASLATARPLMFRLALQLVGPETPQGREFAGYWRHQAFRHIFAVITVVWGAVFLAETAAQVLIIEQASASTAKTTSNLLPVAVAGATAAWTALYGRRRRARGQRAGAPLDAGASTAAGVAAPVPD
jgi:hypothetical protein